MKKNILLFAILVGMAWSMAVTAAIPEMKFRRLDTRNGLSNSQVNCVYRDSRGFVWIGTAYGLNRYDGYRVKTFFSNMRDTTTMRDNYTDMIMEAYDGRLWLKQGMNYCIYDPVTEKFERNVSKEVEKFLGPHNAVEYVYIDSKKNFWIKFYEESIFYYNPTTKKSFGFPRGYSANELKTHYAIAAITDSHDGVVILTYTGELVYLNGETGKIEWENTWIKDHGAKQTQNHRLQVDRNGNFWVMAEEYTFCYINKEKRWYSTLPELLRAKGIENVPEKMQVWDLKMDNKGWLWVTTDHEGLFVVDFKNRQMRQFLNNKYDETSISENSPRQLFFDQVGTVWIATYKNGVNQYKEGMASIRHLDLGDINTVSEDLHGNYWIGSNTDGIIVYDPQKGEVVNHFTTANSPLFGNIMVGSCRAKDGSIWFGSYNGGLTRCIPSKSNPYEATIQNWKSTGSADGLSSNNVWSVTEDKWGRIWISTLGGGIQMLNLKTNKFRTWNQQNNKSLPSDYMTSMWWIKPGWLMVGTSWFWALINPVTGKLANRVPPGFEQLPVNQGSTVCVMEDSRGLIWQGSSSGVIIWDKKTNGVWLLDMTKGLFGSSVCSITEDFEHTMWVVTDHGVSKIVPQHQEDGSWRFTVRSYNNRDGLQQEVYNQRSACLTHNGLVLIGGQGGLDVINPKALSDAKSKERPILSGLLLFDEIVPVGQEIDGRIILDEALDECRSITLRYNDQFTIQLGSDAGIISNGKRFVYKLEGFNDNWVRTSELNPNITYNSLSAGSYTLLVRMLNDDGTIGDEEVELNITIQSAWWLTRWAILVYVILIALGLVWWRRRYMKRQALRMEVEAMRHELEKKQWMGQMRQQMASEKAQEPIKTPQEPKEQQMVKQTTDVVTLLRHICEDYQKTARNKTKVTFLSAAKELDADIAITEFTSAIHILMDNAVRFSVGEARISIGVARTADNKIQIQVADNGVGINDEFKATAFDHNPDIEEIGLAKVKDIVVAHDGDIRLEDNPGGGTIFFITLPIADVVEDAVVMDEEEGQEA